MIIDLKYDYVRRVHTAEDMQDLIAGQVLMIERDSPTGRSLVTDGLEVQFTPNEHEQSFAGLLAATLWPFRGLSLCQGGTHQPEGQQQRCLGNHTIRPSNTYFPSDNAASARCAAARTSAESS